MIQTWFPTSVYSDVLTRSGLKKFNRELLEQCYLVRKTDPEGRAWSQTSYVGGYTSYGSITDLHRRYPHFMELQEHVDRHAGKFARHLEMDLGAGHLEMVSCWINIMPDRVVHSSHLHPLSVLSGTYYVSVPKGASAIKFEDPRLGQMMAAPPKLDRCKPRNQTFTKMNAKDGQVALWESWLRHEVPAHRAGHDRVSISFNYDWL